MIKNLTRDYFLPLSIILFIFLTHEIIEPLTWYYHNINEFDFSIWQVIPGMIVIFFISTILTFILFLLLPYQYKSLFLSIIFGIGVMLWIKGNILIWDAKLLVGISENIRSTLFFGTIELIIFLIILFICIYRQNTVIKIIPIVISIILISQMITLGNAIFDNYNLVSEDKSKYYSMDDMWHFSQDRNVVIILVDGFQSDIFNEILIEDPSIVQNFSGFTYFKDFVGGYSWTYPSILLILSGEYYQNDVPLSFFNKKVIQNHSIIKTLNNEGFYIDILSHKGAVYPDNSMISNIVNDRNIGTFGFKMDPIKTLYLYSLNRLSPKIVNFLLIRYHIIDSSGMDKLHEQDIRIYNSFKKIDNASIAPSFKFIHLVTPHPPFNLCPNLTLCDLPGGKNGYKIQTYATLKIVEEFIANLKKIGVFDNSIIFIVGDHGNLASSDFNNSLIIDDSKNWEGAEYSNSYKGLYIPLLLFKPLYASGNISVSNQPVDQSMIPSTICDELNISDFPYKSPSILENNTSLIRKAYIGYQWGNNFKDELYEFSIIGHSWANKSWIPTGKKFSGVIENF